LPKFDHHVESLPELDDFCIRRNPSQFYVVALTRHRFIAAPHFKVLDPKTELCL
jgi:hypothetical protein